MSAGAVVLTRPEDIAFASWLALRGALKLEAIGMKRSGMSVNTIACQRLGLKRGTRVATTLAVLEAHIADIKRARLAAMQVGGAA